MSGETIEVTENRFTVEVNGDSIEIVDAGFDVSIVSVGIQGPQGPAGEAAQLMTATAGEALTALKIVYGNRSTGKVNLASGSVAAHADSIVGMTSEAASLDELVSIHTFGKYTDNSWTWDMGADPSLYLGSNGNMTQTVPTSGFLLPVGFALSATSIFFRIELPIVLV